MFRTQYTRYYTQYIHDIAATEQTPSVPALRYNALYYVFFALLLALTHSNSLAQGPGDLQQIQKRQDEVFRERQRQLTQPSPDVRLDPGVERDLSDDIPDNETPCFIIHEIRLQGFDRGEVSEASASAFQWALDKVLYPDPQSEDEPKFSPLLGKCYGPQGINAMMRRVQNTIIQRGYVTTRIVAGPQDLKAGTLILTVIPGRIHKIKTDRNRHLLPLKEGALLNLRHIEQILESLKRLPSVQADIQIVAATGEAAQAGASDLIIAWQQGRPWRVGLSVDNAGTQSTGKSQATLLLAYDDLANLNDRLSINIGHDLGDARPGDGGNESYYFNYSCRCLIL